MILLVKTHEGFVPFGRSFLSCARRAPLTLGSELIDCRAVLYLTLALFIFAARDPLVPVLLFKTVHLPLVVNFVACPPGQTSDSGPTQELAPPLWQAQQQ